MSNFREDLDGAAVRLVNRALAQVSADTDAAFHCIFAFTVGQAAEHISTASKSEAGQHGWAWTDAHLKACSEAMAGGQRVRVVPEHIELGSSSARSAHYLGTPRHGL